jgi:5-methylcytosine-specific restriction endonuclease McrA
MEYSKICKDPRCRKPFVSTSKNQAFCCPACQKRYYDERKKRRSKYEKTKEENQMLSTAYRLSNLVADFIYPEKVCAKCGKESTHVHHIDMNPLNNSPKNLLRLCEKCHKQLHALLPKVNMVECLQIAKAEGIKVEILLETKVEGVDMYLVTLDFLGDDNA